MKIEDIRIGQKYRVDKSLRTDWPNGITPNPSSWKEFRIKDGDIITVSGINKDVRVFFGTPQIRQKPSYFIDAVQVFYCKEHNNEHGFDTFVPVDWLQPIGQEYPQ